MFVEQRPSRLNIIALARECVADMPMGVDKAMMAGLVDYAELVPAQIEAAVQAERVELDCRISAIRIPEPSDAWASNCDGSRDTASDLYAAAFDSGVRAAIAVIRARGVTVNG